MTCEKMNWETYSVPYLSIGLFCMSFSIWNLICIFQSLLFVCSNCWIHLSFWFSFSKIFQNTDNFIICLQSYFFIELICFGLNSKERTSSSATNSTRQVSAADRTKFFLFIFLRQVDSMISSMTRKKYLNFFHSV